MAEGSCLESSHNIFKLLSISWVIEMHERCTQCWEVDLVLPNGIIINICVGSEKKKK